MSAKKKRVLDYLLYGETFVHTKGGKQYEGYHKHPTCSSRNPWYALNGRSKYSIFSPSIFWGRHLLFFPNKQVLATDCLDEIEAIKPEMSKALCAIMNTTLEAMFYEFSGRYVENRDKTISNEIKIYELENMLTINPELLPKDVIADFEEALDALCGRDIGLVSQEILQADKQRLDSLLFIKVLGLTGRDMKELQEATAELYRRRIERLAGESPVAEEEQEEEDEEDSES